MSKLIILTITAIVLISVVVFIFYRDADEVLTLPTLSPVESEEPDQGSSISQPTPSESGEIGTTLPTSRYVAVTYSDSGYSPLTITVKKGDTVVFENNSSRMLWMASAVHPTHKAYPGSDIAKCGTTQSFDPAQGKAAGMFDACKGYPSDVPWGFQFNEIGTWKYHNHLQPNHTGTIVVE